MKSLFQMVSALDYFHYFNILLGTFLLITIIIISISVLSLEV